MAVGNSLFAVNIGPISDGTKSAVGNCLCSARNSLFAVNVVPISNISDGLIAVGNSHISNGKWSIPTAFSHQKRLIKCRRKRLIFF